MPTANTPLLRREDTLLGVCEGLGQDIGLPPILFRLGFTALLFWNTPLALTAYVSLGVLVYALRWLMPDRAAASPARAVDAAHAPAAAVNDAAPVPAEAAA
ncbi:PspC domain-containing protein [Sphingomonas canadensis]|uniref:PspC domain-containing protein n=1 Tax=Sphingomonas canadensis TaxID=1219257 RepID=A0ABW3H1G8_9SPHN|nr:PspC domain-containing protein [Sphingomonas canadensis]MCW3835090.1 PspC domain-containing protein [Sphingomonas canadensis]